MGIAKLPQRKLVIELLEILKFILTLHMFLYKVSKLNKCMSKLKKNKNTNIEIHILVPY